jgi:hypothetical protein
MLDDEGQGDYVLVGEARVAGGEPKARVAFNLQDQDNYYALELAPPHPARLLRVESGLELPIGRELGGGQQGRKWVEFMVRCEGGLIEVFLDGQRVAEAADDTFPGGRIASGSLRGSVEFRDLRVQDTAPVYFDDDFMRAEGETGGWDIVTGQWRIQSVGSPVRSTNAFNFTVDSAPKGATAVCGNWFWHDYEVAVSCQPHGPAQAGLYAYYRDPQNHLLFTCGQASPKGGSVAELFAVTNGKRRSLAREPAQLAPGQWYRLALRVDATQVTGSIDGHPVLTASTEPGPGGRAGLYAAGRDGVTFDDFSVRQSNAVIWYAPSLDLWHRIGGSWDTILNRGEHAEISGQASSSAKVLLRQALSGDARIASSTIPPRGGVVGLVAGWEDDRNYHALTWGGQPPVAKLVTVRDGQTQVQDEAPVASGDAPLPMELSLVGQAVRGRVGDQVRLTGANGALPRGRIGLLVENGSAEFTPPEIERISPLPEVAHFEGAFSEEVSMADWAAQNADWTTVAQEGAASGPSYWHKAPAYGDQQLSVRLASPPAGPVSVMVAASGVGTADGYRFTVTPGEKGAAILLRGEKPAVTQALPNLAAEGIQEVGLSKQGPLLVGLLNGQPTVSFRDPDPLSGLFGGWTAPAGAATPTDATFRAENVLSYSFREAPSDWWIGSGDWRITNRWDCEPRWTFFIGGGKGVACLWNKHEFGPDLTLDFYSAIRFDSTQGYEYRYASDINCTVAADGRDLSSGYSFMLGGWDNKYTRLLRGNQVVAEAADKVIPRSSSIHRQWFNLRLRKSGGRLRCWLDGAPLFDYTDPDPLTGNRVALWTYNNAIALARVRIASNEIRPGPLAAPEGPPRCPYDSPTP